ncbi:venom serine protease inhibitor-like [Spea bombifrons]|uniref:venom serine protease inhibitor-like n=1 Tax=Spea bombifrons TaxID=233779 RepID=UPI00234B5D2E|nr:venom serine protease inhibitor-like [Spea bombifrons]
MAELKFLLSVKLIMLVMSSYWIGEAESQNQTPTCPTNQTWTCMKTCHQSCQELSVLLPMCPRICQMGCECNNGLIFKSKNSKLCVPHDQCRVNCPRNMHYNPCSSGPRPTCDTLGNPKQSSGSCVPQCVCNKGFVFVERPDPRCVPVNTCSRKG